MNLIHLVLAYLTFLLNIDYRFGEVLDGRYEIAAAHGKGVFSTVVRAKDLKAGHGEPEEVAIKILRSNETMYVLLALFLVMLLWCSFFCMFEYLMLHCICDVQVQGWSGGVGHIEKASRCRSR